MSFLFTLKYEREMNKSLDMNSKQYDINSIMGKSGMLCNEILPLQIGMDINLYSGLIIMISSYILWVKFNSTTSEIFQIHNIDKELQNLSDKSMNEEARILRKLNFRKEIILSIVYISFFAAITAYNIHIITCDTQYVVDDVVF